MKVEGEPRAATAGGLSTRFRKTLLSPEGGIFEAGISGSGLWTMILHRLSSAPLIKIFMSSAR